MEDVWELNRILEKSKNLKSGFVEFYRRRKVNDDAIANMALENFTEMMSKTGNERFLIEKEIEIELSRRFPAIYASRYTLVTHSLIPYDLCLQLGEIQQMILSELSQFVSSAEKVDYNSAKRMLDRKIVPFLKKNHISEADFNYSSKYYPAVDKRARM